MNGTALVPTFEGELNGYRQPLVDARVLHQFLESKQQFANWVAHRLDEFQASRDYLVNKVINQVPHQGGVRATEVVEYHLSLRTAQHVALMERTKVGRSVRDYFIDMEDRARNTIPSLGVVRVFGLRHPDARLTPEKRQALLESRPDWLAIYPLAMKGMNGNEIADVLGQAKTTVYNKISRMRMCGILPPHPRRLFLNIEMEMREDTQKQEMQQWQALPGNTDT